MRKTRLRNGAAALLFLGVFVFYSGPEQAFPLGISIEKCKGNVPDGAFTCDSKGGTVTCFDDGVYMCCTKNAQGGQDCEQIESSNPKGGKVIIPGGPLKNVPVDPSTGTGTVRQPVFPGTKAPIMRRGIEGEQPAEPTPGTPTSPDQPSGTKPQ